MGFRFRKSVTLFPGVRLNLTKNGMNSLSLGGRGATVNLGKKGARTTVGVPGTGMSQSEYTPYHADEAHNDNAQTADHDQKPARGGAGKILVIIMMTVIVLAKVVVPMIAQYTK